MTTFTPGQRVRILSIYVGHTSCGTVARVSPTGKHVWVTMDARHIIRDVNFNLRPTTGQHVNEWHGYLLPMPTQA